MGRVTIRPVRRDDFQALEVAVPNRVKGFAAERDNGTIMGVGGICLLPDGRKFAFTELHPDAHKYPVSLHLAALRVMAEADAMGIAELYALADMVRSAAAERWLKRLGFVPEDGPGERTWIRKCPGLQQ